jgi:putative oxidoreductase
MRLKWYETTARYILGAIYLFGAIDGALFLLFGMYIHGKPPEHLVFLITLQATTYFWVFLKSIQAIGAVSLLANYKPAFGNAVLLPVSSVLLLFYLFEGQRLLPTFGLFIFVSTIVLTRAYFPSYRHLFDNYPARSRVPAAALSAAPQPAAQPE